MLDALYNSMIENTHKMKNTNQIVVSPFKYFLKMLSIIY
ncbi:hypothetical protein TRIP_D440123 [uncultured Paludibacter sp.]|uniref:Uncharacterized protein n=1 Tax=uncultured Paludibacter sp. TaxID=497635 RepID=A0A653AK76_9BACT|nr:hypothetical protein TRIP_D440123 [uncultured Paludibacter sp.]